GFDIFVIGADIADMGKGEGDDLASIGGIGEDFLITGHGGVEAHFSGGHACRADAAPLKSRPVAQDEDCGGCGFFPTGHGASPFMASVRACGTAGQDCRWDFARPIYEFARTYLKGAARSTESFVPFYWLWTGLGI